MSRITICLSRRERALLQKYGYPFDDIEKQLKRHAASRAQVDISDDAYWWEQVAGQLAISVNEELDPERGSTWDEVNELADRIEYELQVCRRRESIPQP